MPWLAHEPCGGFGAERAWLPLGEENLARAVDVQDADEASLLAHTRAMLALRNAHPALHHGDVTACEAQGALLRLERTCDSERIVCVFNLSDAPIALPSTLGREILCSVNDANREALPPFAALMVRA